VIEELARADDAIHACLDASVWALPEAQLVEALDAVHAIEQRLAAVKLALIREIDGRGVAVAHGASSTAVWLRERLRVSVGVGRRLVADAEALADHATLAAGSADLSSGGTADAWSVDPAGSPAGRLLGPASSPDAGPAAVWRALAAGTVSLEQARVIADTVRTVQQQAGSDAAGDAAGLLVGWAGEFEPAILRSLAARILHHVAPQIAEEADRRALTEAEKRADRNRQLILATGPDGQTRLTGRLDAETAALLHTALDPLAAPTGIGDDRTPGQRRHDALAEICRLALRTGQLPDAGGDATQLVVTTSFDALNRALAAGSLDSGAQLSPVVVRRLACDAGILPAVLGGHSQVLDIGRLRRLFTGPLRRALVLRDGGCRFPGCDRPPRWTTAHHIVHWADGGATSLDNAVLLCRHHHREIHRHDWQVRIAADGLPEFIPPAWVDSEQRPRRNQYHRRC
jgi:Domain of unknown function (DUF222)/HNH endonuclease